MVTFGVARAVGGVFPSGAKLAILMLFAHEPDELGAQVGLGGQAVTPDARVQPPRPGLRRRRPAVPGARPIPGAPQGPAGLAPRRVGVREIKVEERLALGVVRPVVLRIELPDE